MKMNMIGKCPHCRILLKEAPFGERITNEVMLTLMYRDLIENNRSLPSMEQKGYCVLCKATKMDHKKQKGLMIIT